MAIDQQKMLQTIYDTLFAAFTEPPPGGEGGSQRGSTFLSLSWPADVIDVSQYANAWSPQNPTGTMYAVENFSRLVDKVPLVNVGYSPSGQLVSQIYDLVTNATVIPPDPDPVLKKKYEDALKFLTKEGVKTEYDDEGKPVEVWDVNPSPVYGNYKKKMTAYIKAAANLIANYIKYDMSVPKDQREWALLGPTFQDPVDTAYNDLIAAQKTKVEDNLAILSQSSENQVGNVFASAKMNFNKPGIKLSSTFSPGEYFRASYGSPGNWFSASAAQEWPEVTVESSRYTREESSDFTSYGGSAGIGWGFWSIGAGFNRQESHQHMSRETSDVKVNFKFTKVEIFRPWLNFLLFNIGGWKLGEAYPRHGLSNGTKNQPKEAPFPLLPTAFIAATDVNIEASWGKEDLDLIETKLQAGAEFGWGPFKIGGSYNTSSTRKKYSSDFDGTTIHGEGIQIIGWINTVVPACPPL